MALRLVLHVTKELAATEARTGRILIVDHDGFLVADRAELVVLTRVGVDANGGSATVAGASRLGCLVAGRAERVVLIRVGVDANGGGAGLTCRLGCLVAARAELVGNTIVSGGTETAGMTCREGGSSGGSSGGLRGAVHLGGRFHAGQYVGGVVGGHVGTPSAPRRGGGGLGQGSVTNGGGSTTTTTLGLVLLLHLLLHLLRHLLRHLGVGLNLLGGSLGSGSIGDLLSGEGSVGIEVLHDGNETLCDLIGGHVGHDDLHQGFDLFLTVVGLNQCFVDRTAFLEGRTSGLLEDLLQEFLVGLNDVGDHRDDLRHVLRDICGVRHGFSSNYIYYLDIFYSIFYFIIFLERKNLHVESSKKLC